MAEEHGELKKELVIKLSGCWEENTSPTLKFSGNWEIDRKNWLPLLGGVIWIFGTECFP
jgi:hypothetical protein